MRPRRISWLRVALLVLVVAALGVVGTAWWIGGELIAPANHKVSLPADFPAQTVSILGDGHAIAGSWRDFGGDSPVVLLLHGSGADRASMVPHARLLAEAGYSVLLIDLQAHGETPGDHITLGWREAADVRAARDWIRARAPGRKVGVVGQSLGGAAVLLGPQPAGFDAVVLESVYPRVARAVENRIHMRVGSAASLLTPLLLAQLKPRLGVSAEQLEPIRNVARVGAPLLVVGGENDQHTTLLETQDLYSSAAEGAQLWIVEGAAHQDFSRYDEHGYFAHVVRFLRKHLGEAQDNDTLKRIVAAQIVANPGIAPTPSVAVEFFAKDLHEPLALRLRLLRLANICVAKFARQCDRLEDVETPVPLMLETMLALGPPFDATLAHVKVPEPDTYAAFAREARLTAVAFQEAVSVLDRSMFTRMAALRTACPSNHDAEFTDALAYVMQVQYQRMEPLDEPQFAAVMQAVNDDGAHLGERLREQWLGGTCKSVLELREGLLNAYRGKVRPFAPKDWRNAKENPLGQSLAAVWEMAFVLARDVDPSVEMRVLEIRGRSPIGAATRHAPPARPPK